MTDPQFHKDISFFAWDYPVYRLMLGFAFSLVIFSIIASLVVHYLFGAIRIQTAGPKITIAARRHLTVLIFIFILLKAVAYWLDRYGLEYSDRGKVTGASYTDVNASLPAKTILFYIALIIAVLVLASIWLSSAQLPAIGFVVVLVLSIVINGIYPAIVQQFTVKPNASAKEMKYISRNIQATRDAYGIQTATNVDYETYQVQSAPSLTPIVSSAGVVDDTNPTVENLRILDPNRISATFTQQQRIRTPYGFQSKLDVDRYTINGTTKDYIVGVRELNAAGLTGDQTNWINLHTVYTHGDGFVAAAADANVTWNCAVHGVRPTTHRPAQPHPAGRVLRRAVAELFDRRRERRGAGVRRRRWPEGHLQGRRWRVARQHLHAAGLRRSVQAGQLRAQLVGQRQRREDHLQPRSAADGAEDRTVPDRRQ